MTLRILVNILVIAVATISSVHKLPAVTKLPSDIQNSNESCKTF